MGAPKLSPRVPLVSVVIPSYNHEKYIKGTIFSVISSTLQDFEIIVVDDGSRDRSVELIQEIRDPRLRLLVQPNVGAHKAINQGVRVARAPWVAILNSDDRCHPNRLESHLRIHVANPDLEASASRVRYISEDGSPVPNDGYFISIYDRLKRIHSSSGSLLASLLVANHLITTSTLFISRKSFEDIGGFIPLRYNHDWFMYLTLAQRGRFRILEEELVDYRRHSANTIAENDLRARVEVAFVTEWHLNRNFASDSASVELLEAMRLLHDKRGMCYRLMLLFQLWRELNGGDLGRVCTMFEDGSHPVFVQAMTILQQEQGGITLRDVVKRVMGMRWLVLADYVVRTRRFLK
jgi:glycosyltransferase involved in cell wall biosynthesis